MRMIVRTLIVPSFCGNDAPSLPQTQHLSRERIHMAKAFVSRAFLRFATALRFEFEAPCPLLAPINQK